MAVIINGVNLENANVFIDGVRTTLDKIICNTITVWENWKYMTTVITKNAQSGMQSKDATVGFTETFGLGYSIKPQNITFTTEIVKGSATWVGSQSVGLDGYNDLTGSWETLVPKTSMGNQSNVLSLTLAGKDYSGTYSQFTIHYGYSSANGSKNCKVKLDINTYWKKGS